MGYLFILLSFLLFSQPNDPEPPQISITSSAEVDVPADQIIFNINVNAEAKTPQKAFALHQKREDALVDLLAKYDIKEKDIHYQPMSIQKESRSMGNGTMDTSYVTRQSVNVTFSDFDIYGKIQVGLIENGYDDFNGQFTSTQSDEGQDKALRKAIQKAKQKAQLIANESGVKLGAIQHISYNFSQPRPYAQESMRMKAADMGSLFKYDQVVTLNATVSVQYTIVNDK